MHGLLASTWPSAFALYFSCALWLAMPFLLTAWLIILVRALVSGDPTSPWLLLPVMLFSLGPAAVTYEWWTATGKLNVLWNMLAWVSMLGLALQAVVLVREAFKWAAALRAWRGREDKSDRLEP